MKKLLALGLMLLVSACASDPQPQPQPKETYPYGMTEKEWNETRHKAQTLLNVINDYTEKI